MPAKRLPRELERVEFRPLPGQDDEWAAGSDADLSPLWKWFGTYPLLAFIAIYLILIGVS